MKEITFTGYISITLRVKQIIVLSFYKINDCAFHITKKQQHMNTVNQKKKNQALVFNQRAVNAELVQIYPEVGG